MLLRRLCNEVRYRGIAKRARAAYWPLARQKTKTYRGTVASAVFMHPHAQLHNRSELQPTQSPSHKVLCSALRVTLRLSLPPVSSDRRCLDLCISLGTCAVKVIDAARSGRHWMQARQHAVIRGRQWLRRCGSFGGGDGGWKVGVNVSFFSDCGLSSGGAAGALGLLHRFAECSPRASVRTKWSTGR